MPSAPIIGIDLGTTTSMVCVADARGKVEIIDPNPSVKGGPAFMPSLFVHNSGQVRVGFRVKQEAGLHGTENIVRNVKREMNNKGKLFRSGGKTFEPKEISGFILEHLRRQAEKQLNLKQGDIKEAVITVPAYFGDVARRATEDAGRKAGFDRVYLLPEPVAAAIGLGLSKWKRPRLVLVVDLGGGTLDITLMLVGRHVGNAGFQVLAVGGDTNFGGLDWDKKIATEAIDTTQQATYEFPDPLRRMRLLDINTSDKVYDEAERIKIALNRSLDLRQDLFSYEDGENPLDYVLTRESYSTLSTSLASQVAAACDAMLRDVQEKDRQTISSSRKKWYQFFGAPELQNLEWSDIEGVYLVGGGGLIREVRRVLEDRCGTLPELTENPQHCVAFGAARCGARLSETPDIFKKLHTRCPHTYGIFGYPGSIKHPKFYPLIKRNTILPYEPEKPVRFTVRNQGIYFSVKIVEERALSTLSRETLQLIQPSHNGVKSSLIRVPNSTPELWLDPVNEREYHVVAEAKIEDIGTTSALDGEQVYFQIRYPESSSLVFSATFRGKPCQVKLGD
ncbi:MAG TPA: Hsp70 family protein [Planctomycetaceae bacterium]|nr:Hsp70 family protein [Planctomycetaceae bacterium]